MDRFRAKPVEVLAFRWDGPETELPDWAAECEVRQTECDDAEQQYVLEMPAGWAIWPGEWVVRDLRTDELFVWDDDEFRAHFEPVEDPTP